MRAEGPSGRWLGAHGVDSLGARAPGFGSDGFASRRTAATAVTLAHLAAVGLVWDAWGGKLAASAALGCGLGAANFWFLAVLLRKMLSSGAEGGGGGAYAVLMVAKAFGLIASFYLLVVLDWAEPLALALGAVATTLVCVCFIGRGLLATGSSAIDA